MNNIDWFGGMGLLTFLRTVGKFARVGVMLSKDSVKSRMGGEENEARRESRSPQLWLARSLSQSPLTVNSASNPLRRGCHTRSSRTSCSRRTISPTSSRSTTSPCRRAVLRFATAREQLCHSQSSSSLNFFGALNQNLSVAAQIGGSDQWGNITAGTDLIRRVQQRDGAFGADGRRHQQEPRPLAARRSDGRCTACVRAYCCRAHFPASAAL